MTTIVLAHVSEIQTFTEFSVIMDGCGVITYTLNPALPFVTLDPVTRKITVAPTLSDQVGDH
jgi:hypothetical protein